jgi:hypothetical protein
MNKWLPVGLFATFFAAIIAATLYFSPSWGLMDDSQLLHLVHNVLDGKQIHWDVLIDSMKGNGLFRPVFYFWAVCSYAVFEHWPTGLYLLLVVGNMLALLFWGLVFYRVFDVRREDYYWTVFFYPLTFFIFTAFWNIFNYISLQEKFMVFFGGLAFYFFQKQYREFRWQDLVLVYVCIALGLFSKATFIFVPLVFAAYGVLDLVIFHYRPKLSLASLILNGIIFASYAFFTFTVQLNQSYTQRYKANLGASAFLERILHLSVIMKVMMLIGLIGAVGVIVYCVRKKRPDYSLSIIIYLGLMAYVFFLMPWGSQSYLISATTPLLLGAFFPVYDWLTRRGEIVRTVMNGLITIVLCLVFFGNSVPNISRMADIGHALHFIKTYHADTGPQDTFFMPPPYGESAYAVETLAARKVVFCGNNVLTDEMFSDRGEHYVMFNDLFPSVKLVGVKIGEEVYSNPTWHIFKVTKAPGHNEDFVVPYSKTFIQKIKIKMRNMY